MSAEGLDRAVILLLRRNILERARRKRIEMGQVFTAAEAWNAAYPAETQIDVGPTGPIARILSGDDPGP